MISTTFIEKINQKWKEGKFVSVGLDPVWEKLPAHLREGKRPGDTLVLASFCTAIVDATKDIANSYKPNSAFFETFGSDGIEALKQICDYIQKTADVPIILDYKRGDVGNTNEGYTAFAFDYLEVDAVTIQPYLGKKAMQPFLDRKEKGIIILCKTSNEGSDEFQNLVVDDDLVYKKIAASVARLWNDNGNCLLVVGGTYPKELADVRSLVGSMPILVPGIGAQGGVLAATLDAGLIPGTFDGLIINSSRGIIYASNGEDFAEAARLETQKLQNEIAEYRKMKMAAQQKYCNL